MTPLRRGGGSIRGDTADQADFCKVGRTRSCSLRCISTS